MKTLSIIRIAKIQRHVEKLEMRNQKQEFRIETKFICNKTVFFFKDKLKQNPGSATLDNAEIVKTQKMQEISKSESNTNNNEWSRDY